MTILDSSAVTALFALVVLASAVGLVLALAAIGAEIKRAWSAIPTRTARATPAYGKLASSH